MNKKIYLSLAALVIIVGGAVFFFTQKNASKQSNQNTNQEATNQVSQNTNKSQNTNQNSTAAITWGQTQNGWAAQSGTPPTCPQTITSPVDLSLVTAILYPGQIRGGNYKPHGGFRFDSATTNTITVSSPLAGNVVRASRYIENGDTQYMFDIMTDCGMMFRFDHLLTLSSSFQAIADQLPAAQVNNSQTTNVNPQVSISAGQAIATAVGMNVNGRNVAVDFGVYDFNKKNAASADSSWAASHDPELAQHALCWIDLFSAGEVTKIKSLPAGDSTSGATSDYCAS